MLLEVELDVLNDDDDVLKEVDVLEDDNDEPVLEAELDVLDDDAMHDGTVMVTASVVIVPPNASPIPVHVVLAPTVMPASSMMIPAKIVLAPSVVACDGVQKTLQADAPASVTTAPAVEFRAPAGLKMYVPFPFSVSGPPMVIAPELQYTPGV